MNIPKVEHLDERVFNAAIAAEVRAELARQDVQQKDLVEKFGWNRSWISNRVTGKIAWGPAELIMLCDYLQIDLGHLLGAAKRVARERTAKVDPDDPKYADPGLPADFDLAADKDEKPARPFDDQRANGED